jgi:uncharacterized protein (TIGR02466 family)
MENQKLIRPDSLLVDFIFPQFILLCEPTVDSERISRECLSLREEDPEGRKLSNIGGWQSKLITKTDLPELKKLVSTVNEICKNIVPGAVGISTPLNGTYEWWVNINKKNQFNVPHAHGGTKYIAIYYAQVPEDPGPLTVIRPDTASPLRYQEPPSVEAIPKANSLYFFPGHLLHYVMPPATDEKERISIAFNFY